MSHKPITGEAKRVVDNYSIHAPKSLKYCNDCREAIIAAPSENFVWVVWAIVSSAVRRYPTYFLLSFLASVASAYMATLAPTLSNRFTDLVVKASTNPEDAEGQILSLVLTLGGAKLLTSLSQQVAIRLSFYLATRTEDSWRYAALKHYYTLPMSFVDTQDSGQVVSQIERGGGQVWSLLYQLIGWDVCQNTITVIVLLSTVLRQAPDDWWIFLLPLPFHIALNAGSSYIHRRWQAELGNLWDTSSRVLYDGLSNIRTVKAFGRDEFEVQRYASHWSGYHTRESRRELTTSVMTLCQYFIETTAIILLMYQLQHHVKSKKMTIGEMGALLSFQTMLFGPLASLHQLIGRVYQIVQVSKPMMNILREKDTIGDAPDAKAAEPMKSSIQLAEVSFSYTKASLALNEVDLTITRSSTVALVGRSGAGKTTITMLLQRLYDPSKGRVLWDGEDIKLFTRKSLRHEITLVPQDTSLFNRSIRDNIAYGRPEATLADVINAAKLAYAHEFIMKLPEGYDTLVGERGLRLSGGERQRVAIARVFLLRPSLLILDESTSNLDTESEEFIQKSLATLKQHNISTLIIAHRLSTVLHSDKIYVLDHGSVVGAGKHSQLLETCPLYSKLYKLNFRDDDVDPTHAKSFKKTAPLARSLIRFFEYAY